MILTRTLPVALLLALSVQQTPEPGFTSLFNGKDFTGWKIGGPAETFTIQDGAIVARGTPSMIYYDGPFRDHTELAYALCREVERLLVELGLDARRMRISAAGGNEPAYVGDDPLGNRENSRVDVFLLDEFADLNERADGRSATP